MKIKFLGVDGSWRKVADSCRTTVGKGEGDGEPSSNWKRKLLLSEHSPIRKLKFSWRWLGIPYWVSTHFVRHKFGIEHWISTQRTDRTGEDRNVKPQGAEVTHESEANAQALITISRKRLCHGASPETQQAWKLVKEEIAKENPELASCMVKDCVYRGHCYEMYCCGYHKTEAFKKELEEYRRGIN
ncbi:MAG: hypothetical protein ABF633_03440 [Clostridium sp.]|uniref:hypothetical protein n=1 Tax=Clostridium sp. TaxID=1506 RepID=UPI0039EC4C6E